MNYESYTHQGVGLLNEDALFINPERKVFGVLDGVSSLVPYLNSKGDTGGFLASQIVKSYFESLHQIENLKDHVMSANTILNKRMTEENIDIIKKDELWGTALAIVKITEDGVEFIQTGDCMILAVYADGEVRPLTRMQVSHLEAEAFDIWKDGMARGLKTREELFATVADKLKNNRYQSNARGGYGVLNGEAEAADFLEYGKINSACLTHLILLTDGLFLPPELAESEPWKQTADAILSRGLEQYAKELIDLEENDPECVEYIRFKKSDDKTGIVVYL
ncbi:protein phosphatase 2C domain-containing protein [Peribacillus deserti]|uniref:PPM-type phosphatase domain-containing protein n=1 Tax=Peribacillus deserti TaxID=673318 RepID=A0A2N5M9I2_9BACI|nr:protein phosphatase 2C domain-containing protein [Peribacillus deserti]PLT31018.1 hypothetical protein CUU66_04220 [Peribacillus deserti]